MELMAEKESLECELDEMQLRVENLESERGKAMTTPKLEELVGQSQALERENSDLQEAVAELNSLLQRVRESARAEHKQDTERLQTRIGDLEAEARERDQEIQTLATKIRAMREEKSDLVDEMQSLEEASKGLQCENQLLRQGLKNHQRTIDSLQTEVEQTSDMVLEQDYLEVKKQLSNLVLRQVESEKRVATEKAELVGEISRLEGVNSEQFSRLKTLEKELKAIKEYNEFLTKSLEEWKDKATDLTDKMQKTREHLQKESTDRMIKLKQEKIQLEERINELMDQFGTDRRSSTMLTGQPSLMDELQLLEAGPRSSRHSRISMSARQSTPDKNFEALRLELVLLTQSEKEFLNKSLSAEVEKLREEVGSLTRRCFTVANTFNQSKEEREALGKEGDRLKAEIVALRQEHLMQSQALKDEVARLKSDVETWKADLARAQTELIGFKEAWAVESTELKKDLVEAEHQAIEAKMMYAEAATDRDIYLKMYKDASRPPPPKSRLSIFKSRKN